MSETIIHLRKQQFGERERLVVEAGHLRASSFLFDSGVHAIRLESPKVALTLLPYQGQQIWQAIVGGRDITMRSMFREPRATSDYLSNYGGFLIHCGVTAMGVPSASDSHPLHGELPNAPYQNAHLVIGKDEKGKYLGLGGSYQHTVAFSHNYIAQPLVKVYEDGGLFSAELVINNLKNSDMELMYLAHINFRPVDYGRIVYSAQAKPEHVRVRRSIPSHVTVKAGYAEFLDELAQKPEKHHLLKPELLFDPEVVFLIDYLADANGWAHSLQLHPDGNADYMRHRPSQLGYGVRWICRTADQDALGIADPATAEPEGYTAEKEKGNIRVIPPAGNWRMDVEMGILDADESLKMTEHIANIIRVGIPS
ncbi:MAG: DUF4432 family protein [Chloroflexi bacterium AL-N5]|nr:DUF4432 family protein [Chloroflexi bacterium AL-N5]